MKRYRILYHHRIRADDGQAVHVRELIGALRRQGHDVLECALVPKAAAAPAAGLAVGPDGTAAAAGRPSRWQRLRLPRAAVEVLEVLYNRRGRAMLRAAAARFRPDFVYERHALHCRAGLDVARESSLPLLLEVNSPMVDEMRTLGLLKLPARAAATERAVLGGADRVFAVTRVLADRLVQLGAPAERIRVVPNGAQPERYGDAAVAQGRALRQRLPLAAGAFVLGFVGYMRPWHRLDLVLAVMQRPALQQLHLLLVGQGPALAELLGRSEQLGLRARVHAVGEVPPAALPAWVCAFDAALIPSINAYASPLKLFDTLAAAVPTLLPDQPNLREIVTDNDNGLLFAAGDAESLASRLQPLVADRAAARRLGHAGRDSLVRHRWTWDGNAERVLAAFEEVRR